MSKKKEEKKSAAGNVLHTETGDMALGKQNYILMLIGLGIILLGFILMIGDTDIYDFRKLTLAPIVIMFGFLFEIYAIMKKPKGE